MYISVFLCLSGCKTESGTSLPEFPPPDDSLPVIAPSLNVNALKIVNLDDNSDINFDSGDSIDISSLGRNFSLRAVVSDAVEALTFQMNDLEFLRLAGGGWTLTEQENDIAQRYPFQIGKDYEVTLTPQNTSASTNAISGPSLKKSFRLVHPSFPTELTTLTDCSPLDLATSTGNVWYVDPVHGSMAGDGSAASPWSTLQEVITQNLVETKEGKIKPFDGSGELQVRNPGAPIKAGDTIYLMTGNHGTIDFRGAYNDEFIKVIGAEGNSPRFESIQLAAASKWYFSNIKIETTTTTLFSVLNHSFHGPSDNIIIANSVLQSVDDSSGWADTDWVSLASNGINSAGYCTVAFNNHLKNVQFGVSLSGHHSIGQKNTIQNFSADGMRATASHSVLRDNYIADNYDVDANHDDGIQSFTFADPIDGLIIDRNTIIQVTDPNRPLQGPLQGIGFFDGFFDNIKVTNNIVIVEALHGIAIYGAHNAYVANNTVVGPANPWIAVVNHKDGRPSDGVIENNLTTATSVGGTVTAVNNILIANPSDHFVLFDWANADFDVHLKSSSSAVGNASENSTDVFWDRDGYLRGNTKDVGALCHKN